MMDKEQSIFNEDIYTLLRYHPLTCTQSTEYMGEKKKKNTGVFLQ